MNGEALPCLSCVWCECETSMHIFTDLICALDEDVIHFIGVFWMVFWSDFLQRSFFESFYFIKGIL